MPQAFYSIYIQTSKSVPWHGNGKGKAQRVFHGTVEAEATNYRGHASTNENANQPHLSADHFTFTFIHTYPVQGPSE